MLKIKSTSMPLQMTIKSVLATIDTLSSDELPFNKMHGFSTVDGFVEINESLAEMIKYVANEPSVGLFYVQQHTQNAVPNVISLKNNIVQKSHETNLHTEDLEDSITMVRSMKECGFPIAEDMIKDIKKSLAIMSTKEPKRGLIHNPNSRFQMGRTSSWGPATWGRTKVDAEPDGERSGYFSNVLKSAKQKANNLKWSQLDSKDSSLAASNPPLSIPLASSGSNMLDMEADELPLSNQVPEELQEVVPVDGNGSLPSQNLMLAEDYDDFRANREVKLNEWLEGKEASDAERL